MEYSAAECHHHFTNPNSRRHHLKAALEGKQKPPEVDNKQMDRKQKPYYTHLLRFKVRRRRAPIQRRRSKLCTRNTRTGAKQ